MPRFREERVNVEVARSLSRRALDAHAETVERGGLPDVLIQLGGQKLIIEGRAANQRASLLVDAQRRVTEGMADLSVAILYTPDLYVADSEDQLRSQIEAASFNGAVYYPGDGGIEEIAFNDASMDELAEAVRTAFRIRVEADVVQGQVDRVQAAIENVVHDASMSGLFDSSEALASRLRAALGMPEPGVGAAVIPSVAVDDEDAVDG